MRVGIVLAALLTLAGVPTQLSAQARKQPKTDAEMIANAMSAAPKAVAKDATIVVPDSGGQLRTLRQGTNNFTCMPDDPATPGNDPMCMDQTGMEWAKALMSHTDPPSGKAGFGYMLQGGPAASNTDPFAKEPAAGKKWVETGPHVMILNPSSGQEGYPEGENPDTQKPYVMWAGTPYAHLMVPVR
jgi:hypothetical protein